MNDRDWAILIGIKDYPTLGEGNTAADLQGPHNDIRAVETWLVCDDEKGGGGVPPLQVIKVPSQVTGAGASPTVANLEDVFEKIESIADDNVARRRDRVVGRRLYIYVSGHGFSPSRNRACLFSADARFSLGRNMHITGWLTRWQDAGYFREFVLWVDACMDRLNYLPPQDPQKEPFYANTPPLANFVAFAAQRPLKAVEQTISEDGGAVHGVFTWCLLEGLRGAAANQNGRVTGASLANWLRNSQSARYSAANRNGAVVAQEPEIVSQDDGLVLVRGVAPPSYNVTLQFPPHAIDADAVIFGSGTPFKVVATQRVKAIGRIDLELPPGLYLVSVPVADLRQGFEVLCPVTVEVLDSGPEVVLPSALPAMFTLSIDAGDAAAEIFVIDARLALVDNRPARLHTPLPPGLFKIKIRIGNAVTQRVILLDRNRDERTDRSVLPSMATVVPVGGTSAIEAADLAKRKEAVDVARAMTTKDNDAILMIVVRSNVLLRGRDGRGGDSLQGLEISTGDDVVLKLSSSLTIAEQADGVVSHRSVVLPPGCICMRMTLADGQTMECSLVLIAGWRTEVYLIDEPRTADSRRACLPRISVMMHSAQKSFEKNEREERAIEAARAALASERRILNAELETILLRDFLDPMAGIFGCHLLLVEHEREPARSLALLDSAVRRLINLVGRSHPDVAALCLRCDSPSLRRIGPLSGLPMLHRSWAILLEAATTRPALVPASLWQRAVAQTSLPPFLIWNPVDGVKREVRRELVRALGLPKPVLKVRDGNIQFSSQPQPAAVVIGATDLTALRGATAQRSAADPLVSFAAQPASFASSSSRTKLSKSKQMSGMAVTGSWSVASRKRAARMGVPASALELLLKDPE